VLATSRTLALPSWLREILRLAVLRIRTIDRALLWWWSPLGRTPSLGSRSLVEANASGEGADEFAPWHSALPSCYFRRGVGRGRSLFSDTSAVRRASGNGMASGSAWLRRTRWRLRKSRACSLGGRAGTLGRPHAWFDGVRLAMPLVRKFWCRLRGGHAYRDDGAPIPMWTSEAAVSHGSYRQVRRCVHCGDQYDTFAGLIETAVNEIAAQERSAA
jgi:hypothetical protein